MEKAPGTTRSIPVGGIIFFLILAAAVAWLISSVWLRQLQPPDLRAESLGALDPDWKVEALDGTEVSIGELKGKPIFVNIWATWCGPCVMEMPSIEALYKSVKDKAHFLVVSQEPSGAVAAAVRKHGWSLPIYTARGELPAILQTNGIPATFIVDKQGDVVFEHIGAADWDVQEVRDFLAK